MTTTNEEFPGSCDNCQIVYDLLKQRDQDIFDLKRKNQVQENLIQRLNYDKEVMNVKNEKQKVLYGEREAEVLDLKEQIRKLQAQLQTKLQTSAEHEAKKQADAGLSGEQAGQVQLARQATVGPFNEPEEQKPPNSEQIQTKKLDQNTTGQLLAKKLEKQQLQKTQREIRKQARVSKLEQPTDDATSKLKPQYDGFIAEGPGQRPSQQKPEVKSPTALPPESTYRSNLMQEELVDLPRQIYNEHHLNQRPDGLQSTIDAEPNSEQHSRRVLQQSIYMEYRVDQGKQEQPYGQEATMTIHNGDNLSRNSSRQNSIANHPNFFGSEPAEPQSLQQSGNKDDLALVQYDNTQASNLATASNDLMQTFLEFKKNEIAQTLTLHKKHYSQYNLKFSQFRTRYVNWQQKKVKQQKLINDHIIEKQKQYLENQEAARDEEDLNEELRISHIGKGRNHQGHVNQMTVNLDPNFIATMPHQRPRPGAREEQKQFMSLQQKSMDDLQRQLQRFKNKQQQQESAKVEERKYAPAHARRASNYQDVDIHNSELQGPNKNDMNYFANQYIQKTSSTLTRSKAKVQGQYGDEDAVYAGPTARIDFSEAYEATNSIKMDQTIKVDNKTLKFQPNLHDRQSLLSTNPKEFIMKNKASMVEPVEQFQENVNETSGSPSTNHFHNDLSGINFDMSNMMNHVEHHPENVETNNMSSVPQTTKSKDLGSNGISFPQTARRQIKSNKRLRLDLMNSVVRVPAGKRIRSIYQWGEGGDEEEQHLQDREYDTIDNFKSQENAQMAADATARTYGNDTARDMTLDIEEDNLNKNDPNKKQRDYKPMKQYQKSANIAFHEATKQQNQSLLPSSAQQFLQNAFLQKSLIQSPEKRTQLKDRVEESKFNEITGQSDRLIIGNESLNESTIMNEHGRSGDKRRKSVQHQINSHRTRIPAVSKQQMSHRSNNFQSGLSKIQSFGQISKAPTLGSSQTFPSTSLSVFARHQLGGVRSSQQLPNRKQQYPQQKFSILGQTQTIEQQRTAHSGRLASRKRSNVSRSWQNTDIKGLKEKQEMLTINTQQPNILSQVSMQNEVPLIDDFMVVGPSPNQLRDEELAVASTDHQMTCRGQVIKGLKLYEPIEASNIYSQTHSINNIQDGFDDIRKGQRRQPQYLKVIKNFCFPDDIGLVQARSFQDVEQLVLKQHFQNINEYSVDDIEIPYTFLFTLNKEEPKKKTTVKKQPKSKISYAQDQDMVMPGEERVQDINRKTLPRAGDNFQDEFSLAESNVADADLEDEHLTYNYDSYMYCFCFRFNQLITSNFGEGQLTKEALVQKIKKGEVLVGQKAFCLLFSTNSFLKMQGQFLMKIYQAYSISVQQGIRNNNYSVLFDDTPTLDRMRPLIQEFLEVQIPNKLRDKDIQINLTGIKDFFAEAMAVRDPLIENMLVEQSQINFRIARTQREIQYDSNETFYHCIIELLSPQDLINILKAILLEKSFIFVGAEHLTSQFILGLSQLIHPFKWCFSIIPILPTALLAMLEAPVPLMVGITAQEYNAILEEGILENEMDQKIWMHLKLDQNPQTDEYLPLKIENLEILLDMYLIDRNHSISTPSSCLFGNLLNQLNSALSLPAKAAAISNCMRHHIIPADLLSSLQQQLDFKNEPRKTLMKHIDNLTKEHHHLKLKTSPSTHKLGDIEFMNQFIITQTFASYMDDFIEQHV